MLTCTDCRRTKPLSAFTAIKGTPYTHKRCKPCRAAWARAERPLRLISPGASRPGKSGPKPKEPAGIRTCSGECGETKPIEASLPINGQRRTHV